MAERRIPRDQNGLSGQRVGGNHHIQRFEIDTFTAAGRLQIAINVGYLPCPRQYLDSNQEFMNERTQGGRMAARPTGKATSRSRTRHGSPRIA